MVKDFNLCLSTVLRVISLYVYFILAQLGLIFFTNVFTHEMLMKMLVSSGCGARPSFAAAALRSCSHQTLSSLWLFYYVSSWSVRRFDPVLKETTRHRPQETPLSVLVANE